MKKFSTYLVVMFMIVFWILRIVITLSAEMGSNFLGITPINETFEIVILFATLVCAILIVKRKLVGSLLYLAIHAVYFGGDVTDKLNIMANNGQLTVAQSTDFIFSVIGIILPLAVLLDLLLDKNRKYLVGVSGGVDSMALLDMLVKKAYNVIVVHYNYHFREDSDLDENLVRSYCQNHHLPFYVRQGDKKEYQKGNFEMLAREKRYAFYKEIGDLNGIDTIILGHHLNDHLETIVMQLQRHNTKGYLGIKEQSYVKNMHVVRPLLKLKKQQLIDYCTKNHLEYHEDYTNYDTRYTRNHVRHIDLKKYSEQELLEKASKHNKQYKKQQANLQQIYQEYDQNHFLYLDKLPTESLDQIIYYMLKKDMMENLLLSINNLMKLKILKKQWKKN